VVTSLRYFTEISSLFFFAFFSPISLLSIDWFSISSIAVVVLIFLYFLPISMWDFFFFFSRRFSRCAFAFSLIMPGRYAWFRFFAFDYFIFPFRLLFHYYAIMKIFILQLTWHYYYYCKILLYISNIRWLIDYFETLLTPCRKYFRWLSIISFSRDFPITKPSMCQPFHAV